MVDVLHLYLDDSGTRNPDKKPQPNQFRNWFGLGGLLINEEDEQTLRAKYNSFCNKWHIRYPLRSFDIRQKTENFHWLNNLSEEETEIFYKDLKALLLQSSNIATACVIDRPNHHDRFAPIYPDGKRWLLCKTAFCVVVERAAKYARRENRKLRVFVERGDPTADQKIREYYCSMRTTGMPFDPTRSAKYNPLTAPELGSTLYDLKLKFKSSPPIQIADLLLYPLCRAGYENSYPPYEDILRSGGLIDQQTNDSEIAVKYSCF